VANNDPLPVCVACKNYVEGCMAHGELMEPTRVAKSSTQCIYLGIGIVPELASFLKDLEDEEVHLEPA
jgi:hypothetical protein